ncbi:MAG: hypothetical protein AAF447_27605, partial [Myxococcota bacterium]
MSNILRPSVAPRPGLAPAPARLAGALAAALLGACSPVPAPGPEEGGEPTAQGSIDEFAESLVAMTARRWAGPRTAAPTPEPRPEAALRREALSGHVAVHGAPGVPARTVDAALAHAEAFIAFLHAAGWAPPETDGGRGGSPALDVYLTPTPRLAEAAPDVLDPVAYLDRMHAFARVDPAPGDLEACVVRGVAEALLLSLDPAEAPAWRRATASALAYRWLGRFACGDGAQRQQQEPQRGWIAEAADEGAGGGVVLALLGEQRDGGSGRFLRELWQLARQRTWEGRAEGLRAGPDLWQALEALTDAGDRRLEDLVARIGVARFFLGAREAFGAPPGLLGLGDDMAPPLRFAIPFEALPEHTAPSEALGPYGASYGLVEVRGAPAESRLRVWLRGEHGVEWKLVVTRLDATGRPLGRLEATPDPAHPRAYLPVELTPETTHVLITAANLSHRLPDADLDDPHVR